VLSFSRNARKVLSSLLKCEGLHYNAIPGAFLDEWSTGAYILPCSARLPNFAFSVETYTGIILGNYMHYPTAGFDDCNCIGGL